MLGTIDELIEQWVELLVKALMRSPLPEQLVAYGTSPG